jgi:UDP-glucose 4-epimerase
LKKKEIVLVTGSKGFIGSHIVKKISKNYLVYGKNGNHPNLLDRKRILNMKKVDIVIHVAAKVPNTKNTKLDDFQENNVFGTLNILDYCIQKKIKKFVYISSYVYGKPKHNPVKESHPVNPHTDYTKSKLVSEELCKLYSKLYDLNMIILRPFSVYGKSQKSGYLIPNLINSIKNNKKIIITNKQSKRDFLFIDDFVNAIEFFLKQDFKFEIFNIGSGLSYSFEEIIQKLEKLSSSKMKVEFIDNKKTYIPEIRADISNIKKKIKWTPKIDIESGLKKLLR